MKLIIDLTEEIGVEHDGETKEVKRIVLTDASFLVHENFVIATHKNGKFHIAQHLIRSIQQV